MEHSLGVDLVALDDRMLLFVAAIANVEVKVADEVSSLRVDMSQALLELFVAHAVKTRKVVVVLQSVLLLARRHVIAVIVISTALVDFFIIAEIFVSVSSVAWSAPEAPKISLHVDRLESRSPFRSRETQIDSVLCLTIPLDRRLAHFCVIRKGSFAL